MRTARVVTNRRCNQNCGFCTERRETDDRARIRRESVEHELGLVIAAGVEEIVLTGGEPTLRRDLGELVRSVAGRARIVLETNGSLLDRASVAALVSAGVDVFRVHAPAFGPPLDRITQDDGASAALASALAAIAATDAVLEVAVPLVRSNLGELAGWPAALLAVVPDPRRIRVVRVTVPTSSPTARELLSFEEAAAALVELEGAARAVGLSIKLADGSGPPPCIVPRRSRPNQLWSLTGNSAERPDRVRIPECERCLVRGQCSGLDAAQVARFGVPRAAEPVAEERVRRRLALIATVEEQIAREFITADRARDADGGVVDEEIIRVQFHCNQSCGFCFVSTHLPPPGHDAVIEAIRDALGRSAKVVLSGGEPTLSPRLVEYVRLASRGGASPMQLQTNAVRLDDEGLVRALHDAGLREAFVSLHGADASVSDMVTGAPGTHARTLRGLDNLVAMGVVVTVNFVICDSNAAEFPSFVDLVATRWPTATVNVSFVAPSTDMVPRDRELVPRYSDVLPHLAEGLSRAEQAKVAVRGFESMCGLPLCLVPSAVARLAAMAEVPSGIDRGEFTHAEPCGRCSGRDRCFGVRRGYVELHGTSELAPLT